MVKNIEAKDIMEITLPKVEIKRMDSSLFSVKIDGKELNSVKNVNVSLGVGEISIVKMEFAAVVDINESGDSL